MENGPFEDVCPIKHGDIPASYVSLSEAIFTNRPTFWMSPEMGVSKNNGTPKSSILIGFSMK